MNEGITSIAQLETLLNEFYSNTTSNFRRTEIDQILKSIQESDSSYKFLLENLASGFNNQFLWFFSVSTVEITITKKWNKLDLNSRKIIRDYLWHIYFQFPLNVGAMQRDKISQLISLIGKRQFPEEHPEFVGQILTLIKSKFILGITLLKSTFNEISSTKPDVSYHKKRSFIQGISMSLPEIVPLLNKFLTLCVCRISNNEIVFSSSDQFINSSLPNDDRFIASCSELLLCISQMFSWADTNETKFFNSEFFNNIFELCSYANNKFINIHITALMTICELFYLQKPLPQPAIMSNGITELIQQNLSQSLEEYQDKLTELLKLFLAQQWTRCVNSKDFPSKDFLLYLFNFTFQPGISALTFTERLLTWKPIIQSFNEKSAGRYTETIVQLILNVFKKMQFSLDPELDLLDTEELDENMQTELGTFISQCISIITIAAEVEPLKIFDLINNEFTRDEGRLKVFITLIANDDMSKMNYLSSQFEFHAICRDLSSLLQTMTQLSIVVLNLTEERSQSISIVIRSIVYAFKLVARKKLHQRNYGSQQDLIELHAQLLTSLRSLLLLKNDVYEDYEEMFSLVSAVTQILLDSDEPLIVTNSAAQLLLTITSGVRPTWILKNPTIMELIQSDLRHQSDRTVRLSIKRIIFNCLLLPYNKVAVNQIEDQEYERRGQLAVQYVSFISGKFLLIDLSSGIIEGSPEASAIFEQVKAELADCEEILTSYEDTSTISKQMLLAAMQKVINKAIELFQKFGKNPSIYEETVNFFLSVVRCLQLQIGAEFVIHIIRMFLEMATVTNGNGQALNKLLQMLTFIVQQSGSIAGQLMPDILRMTLDELLQQPLDVISVNFYTLFDALLVNHFPKISQEHLLKIFTAFGQFLCNGTNSQDPYVITIILSSLEKLQELWRLYDKAFFKNSLLKSFMSTLIRLLISQGGILFFDQIVSIIFHMAEKNKSSLQESFVAIGFPPDLKIISQIVETSDLPTFSNYMQILIQDTIYTQFSQ